MKKFLSCSVVVLVVVLMSSFAFADGYPELRGTWVGTVKLITKEGERRDNKAVFIIKKQDGNLFSGEKAWFAPNKENLVTEKFCGVIGADGMSLYFAEGEDGYTLGTLTGKENMSLYYLETGRKAMAISYSMERVRFARAFVDIDKDGSKTIIRSEVVKVYPLNAERIMREADLNKDGKLSKKEWEEWKKGK
ncbi:calcium-binding protein [Desulfovibrio sp. JC010]|uniref:calcium-binding protein n=1 Tax=Desulfovibrio sp. JC010 TaxID=2593641 RepID=UPI0013D1E54B|nr:calcium-binding protein [Desulfovibrio sp. JC010]NDV28742.1 calcium-binding protein [Desulfovibrio sp. JC010]